MSELENRFNKAFEDGVIDKKEVNSLFTGLTADDWRALANNHKQGDELFRQREVGTDILGIRARSGFNISEKDDQFVIQNDKALVDGKINWQGAMNFLGTSAVAAVGFLGARHFYGTGIGLAAAGAIAAGGMIKNYFDTRDYKDLAADNYMVKVEKTGLPETSMVSMGKNATKVASLNLLNLDKHRKAFG
jgi:hypothetical protein